MFSPVWPKHPDRPTLRKRGETDSPLRYLCVLAPEYDDFNHRGRVLVEIYDDRELNDQHGPTVFAVLSPDYAREVAAALTEMADHADIFRVLDTITGEKPRLVR